MQKFEEWLKTRAENDTEVNEMFGLFGGTPKPSYIYSVKSFIDDVVSELGDEFTVTYRSASARPMSVRQVVIDAYRDLFSKYRSQLQSMHGSKGPKMYNMFGNAVVEKDPTSLQKLIFAIGKFEGEEHENEAFEIRRKLVQELVDRIKKDHNIDNLSTNALAARRLKSLGRPNARDVRGGEYDDGTRYASKSDIERISKSRHLSGR